MKIVTRVLLSLLFVPLLWTCQKQESELFSLKTPDGEILNAGKLSIFRLEEKRIETYVSFPDNHSLAIQFTQGETTNAFFGDTYHSTSYSFTESYTGVVKIKQQTDSYLILHFSDVCFTLPSGQFTFSGNLKYTRNDEYWVN